MRPSISRILAEWLVVAALCAGFAGLASAKGWLWRIDGVLYDAALSLRLMKPDPDVVVVAIDDRSLAEIGRWPWSRAVHAELLNRLAAAGTKVVAMDIIFHEPAHDRLQGDKALVEAIARHGQVVLPVTHTAYASSSDGEGLPVRYFAEAAAALGHIHIELDPDGIARSVYLWEGMNQPRYPQLALAALALTAPARAQAYPAPQQAPQRGWRRADWMRIPFAGPPGSFHYVSYVDVLRGAVPDNVLRDAVVFVGASAVGMGDMVPTPTSGHAQLMPGVEIHASVFSALRKGQAIHVVPPVVVGAASALLVLLLMLVMLRTGPRTALLAAFGATLAAFAGSALLLTVPGWWLPPAGAVLAAMLAYPLWSWRRLEAAQHYLDAELAALRESSEHFALARPVGERDDPALDRFSARIALVRATAQRQRVLQRFVTDVLEGLPVGALVVDLQGRISFYNRRAVALLGVDEPWALRATVAAMPWPDSAWSDSGFDPGRYHGLGEPVQVEAELADGRVVLASAATLSDDDDRLLGMVVGLSDISDLRNAQRNREETMHFLSHDLRAPLASILTLAEQVTEHDAPAAGGDDSGVEPIERIARYARSALALAENLARLVRAEGVDPTCFDELQLDMLVQDAADEVWALARGKGVELFTVLDIADDEVCSVRGDADLLRRAIINLLTNAIKYTPAGGEVRVRLGRAGGQWAVQVIDTGIGISAAQCAQLFKRFSRLNTAENRQLSGIGLGLLMVRTVAERHGGSVGVSSTPGEGSTFTLSLPGL